MILDSRGAVVCCRRGPLQRQIIHHVSHASVVRLHAEPTKTG
jgi:hypothetical protein